MPNPRHKRALPLQDPATSLSKRAARRIIQRTFVLMGKDKVSAAANPRIAKSPRFGSWKTGRWSGRCFSTAGSLKLERRPAKHPDVTLSWPTAEEFFHQVDRSGDANVQVQILPEQEHRRFFETLLRGFFSCLRHVLANPVDAVGESLL